MASKYICMFEIAQKCKYVPKHYWNSWKNLNINSITIAIFHSCLELSNPAIIRILPPNCSNCILLLWIISRPASFLLWLGPNVPSKSNHRNHIFLTSLASFEEEYVCECLFWVVFVLLSSLLCFASEKQWQPPRLPGSPARNTPESGLRHLFLNFHGFIVYVIIVVVVIFWKDFDVLLLELCN